MSSIQRPGRSCKHSNCKKTATTSRNYCEQHQKLVNEQGVSDAHKRQTKSQRRVKYGKHWKQQRQRILDRDGYSCVYCGSEKNLEVHHMTTSIKARDNELVTLCRRHHRAIEAEKRSNKTDKRITNTAQMWINFQKYIQ